MVVQLFFDCVICGSHSRVNEDSNPMGCYAMSTGKLAGAMVAFHTPKC